MVKLISSCSLRRLIPLLLLALLGLPAHAFMITDADGRPQAQILIPATPLPSTVLAAQEITHYVHKMSGASLTTCRGASVAERQIIIGTLETVQDLPKRIRYDLSSTQNAEALCLMAQGNRLYLIGKSRVADLFAAYTLLDEKLGVRWFMTPMPDDDGEYVPARKHIVLDDFYLVTEPFFIYRRLPQTGSYVTHEPVRGKAWAVRNRFHVSPALGAGLYKKGSHQERLRAKSRDFFLARTPRHVIYSGGHCTFSDAIPISLYENHPEYFSLINGKRVLNRRFPTYCMSNPDVQELICQHIDRLFDHYGTQNCAYLFGQVDVATGWCECPECRKMDDGEFNHLNVSTRFHRMVHRIVPKIYQRHPEARLMVWAYGAYRELPTTFRHDPRMELVLCLHGRCYGHNLDDPHCIRNVKSYKLLRQWHAMLPRGWIYEYVTSSHCRYAPLELRQAHDLKLYQKMGVRGWQEEAKFPDAKAVRDQQLYSDFFLSNWQWLYLTGKLLWNPDLDPQAILKDIESKYYGKAYPAMGAYHAFRRKLWDNTPQCMGYPYGDQRRPHLLNFPGSLEKLNRLLDEAERLAQGNPRLLARIGKDRTYLRRYWIEPNLKLREKLGKTFNAPRTTGKIVIDGKDDERDWIGAYHTSDFRLTNSQESGTMPQELRTTVSMLSDAQNLYFFIQAGEPQTTKMKLGGRNDGPLWLYDSMELFIAPPNASQNYYHVIITPDGAVYDAVNPGNNKDIDFGVEARGRIEKDRYLIEARIPVRHFSGDFRRGNLWRLHLTRNRLANGDANHCQSFSIDGEPNHFVTGYRSLEIGSPYLINGSLDHLRDGQFVGWERQKAQPVKLGNGYAAQLSQHGRIFQALLDRELKQSATPRRISLTCKAWGKGELAIYFYRYTDVPDGKAPYGYRRTNHPSVLAKRISLQGPEQIITLQHTIPANEWHSLGLHSFQGTIMVDDISVKMITPQK